MSSPSVTIYDWDVERMLVCLREVCIYCAADNFKKTVWDYKRLVNMLAFQLDGARGL